MKKVILTALASLLMLSFGATFAQATPVTAEHDVTITIPDVLILRFTASTDADDLDAVTPDDVIFQLTAADVQGADPIAPSNAGTANWGDLKAFVNYDSNWDVVATITNASTPAFDWDKVGVGSWNVNGGTVFEGDTTGWTSLGFGAADFLLTLDGTEIADTYSATVLYTLTAP